jgi:1,4-dihydroxy-6-naphthoate synthase
MTSPPLTLGFSPCPNDTYIFHALVHGLVDTGGLSFQERLADVETLNRLVLAGELAVSKISYHLLGHVRDRYCLLTTGGALGRGCGPLVVGRQSLPLTELRNKPIAVPGRYTTACLLLRLYDPGFTELVVMPFHEIMPAVVRGEVAAGVIIHESRFTFQEHGLVQLADLGQWWEEVSGHPIPLGGIVARRTLGETTLGRLNRALRASVEYARSQPAAARDYIRTHSQEMSDEVCAAHIDLYVNDFSLDLGKEGRAAVRALLERAEQGGIIPPSTLDLFVP